MTRDGFFDRDEPDLRTKQKRNARARYQLTSLGESALRTYQEQVTSAQTGAGGREALEVAQSVWAKSNQLEAHDALLLDELSRKPQTTLELTRSLDTCGIKRPTVTGGVDRLASFGFIEPLPAQHAPPIEPQRPSYY